MKKRKLAFKFNHLAALYYTLTKISFYKLSFTPLITSSLGIPYSMRSFPDYCLPSFKELREIDPCDIYRIFIDPIQEISHLVKR
jgi:hypothetical protein